jgi:hypothetical protein
MAPAEHVPVGPENAGDITQPSTTRAKGKRKTPGERLAEANAPRQPKEAPAPSQRIPETRPNERLEQDFARHQAKQAADSADDDDRFPGDPPSAQLVTDAEENDPQVDAYAAGWIARSKAKPKTAFPPEIIGVKELMAFFGQGWDSYDGHTKAGTAPTTAQESEEMLDRAIDLVFGQ